MISISNVEGSLTASDIFPFCCPWQDPRRNNPRTDNAAVLKILDLISYILVISLNANCADKKIVSQQQLFFFSIGFSSKKELNIN